jgi:hypothetical protein
MPSAPGISRQAEVKPATGIAAEMGLPPRLAEPCREHAVGLA